MALLYLLLTMLALVIKRVLVVVLITWKGFHDRLEVNRYSPIGIGEKTQWLLLNWLDLCMDCIDDAVPSCLQRSEWCLEERRLVGSRIMSEY